MAGSVFGKDAVDNTHGVQPMPIIPSSLITAFETNLPGSLEVKDWNMAEACRIIEVAGSAIRDLKAELGELKRSKKDIHTKALAMSSQMPNFDTMVSAAGSPFKGTTTRTPTILSKLVNGDFRAEDGEVGEEEEEEEVEEELDEEGLDEEEVEDGTTVKAPTLLEKKLAVQLEKYDNMVSISNKTESNLRAENRHLKVLLLQSTETCVGRDEYELDHYARELLSSRSSRIQDVVPSLMVKRSVMLADTFEDPLGPDMGSSPFRHLQVIFEQACLIQDGPPQHLVERMATFTETYIPRLSKMVATIALWNHCEEVAMLISILTMYTTSPVQQESELCMSLLFLIFADLAERSLEFREVTICPDIVTAVSNGSFGQIQKWELSQQILFAWLLSRMAEDLEFDQLDLGDIEHSFVSLVAQLRLVRAQDVVTIMKQSCVSAFVSDTSTANRVRVLLTSYNPVGPMVILAEAEHDGTLINEYVWMAGVDGMYFSDMGLKLFSDGIVLAGVDGPSFPLDQHTHHLFYYMASHHFLELKALRIKQ